MSAEPEVVGKLRELAEEAVQMAKAALHKDGGFPAFALALFPGGPQPCVLPFESGEEKVRWRAALLRATRSLGARGLVFVCDTWHLSTPADQRNEEDERHYREHGIHDDPRRSEALSVQLFAPPAPGSGPEAAGWQEHWLFPYRRRGTRIIWQREQKPVDAETTTMDSHWNPWPDLNTKRSLS